MTGNSGQSVAFYLHVPFFTSPPLHDGYAVPYDEHLADRYLEALARELDATDSLITRLSCEAQRAKQDHPSLFYIGGGQPAALSSAQLQKLLGLLQYQGSSIQYHEASIELDPLHTDEEKLRALHDAGVNRLVVCVASEEGVALLPGCVALARECGFDNIAIDLSAASYRAALETEPEHVSILQADDDGLSEDDFILAYKEAHEALIARGYVHYELWSYAKPGHESRFLKHTWKGGDYIGLGAGAASLQGLIRSKNIEDVEVYTTAWLDGAACPAEVGEVTLEERAIEIATFGLSLCEGIDLAEIQTCLCQLFERSLVGRVSDPAQHASIHPVVGRVSDPAQSSSANDAHEEVSNAWKKIIPIFQALERQGLVTGGDQRWRLTADGRFSADEVMRELLI